ncbi:MAG: SDR family NAD(P)-dependent oxidoreductase, partial [Burkholderiales bacterium]
MTTTTELAGKVALVTGASRNIGRAIALALAAGGAAVAVNSRSSRDDADKVAQEIRGAGGKAEAFMADIVDAKAVNAMVDGIVKRFGRLDILVLNASVRKETPFIDMSFDEWKSLTAVTLDGSFHCVKAGLPHLIKAGGGAIVTIGGMTALSGAKRRVHGSVGKFGLYGMTRALAKELGEHNIRVNCVAPGQMNTARAADRSARPD